jgi:hypothetical protein
MNKMYVRILILGLIVLTAAYAWVFMYNKSGNSTIFTSDINSLSQKLNATQQDLNNTKTELTSAKLNLDSKITSTGLSLNSKIDTTKTDLMSSLTNSSNELNNSIANINGKVTALQTTLNQTINNLSPSDALYTALNSSVSLLTSDNTSNKNQITDLNNKFNSSFAKNASGSLAIMSGTTTQVERIRVDNGGNIGINTVNPLNKVQVGDINTNVNNDLSLVSGTANKVFLSANGDTGMFTINRDPNNNTVATTTKASAGIQLVSNDGDSRIILGTNSVNGTASVERVRVTKVGRVGIGTADPSSILHVKDIHPRIVLECIGQDIGDAVMDTGLPVVAKARVSMANSWSKGRIDLTSNVDYDAVNKVWVKDNTSAAASILAISDTGFAFRSISATTTAPTATLQYCAQLTSDGRFGVNTYNPTGILTINCTGADNYTTPVYMSYKYSESEKWRIGMGTDGNGGYNFGIFDNGPETGKMRFLITSNGNIGIGNDGTKFGINQLLTLGDSSNNCGMSVVSATKNKTYFQIKDDTASLAINRNILNGARVDDTKLSAEIRLVGSVTNPSVPAGQTPFGQLDSSIHFYTETAPLTGGIGTGLIERMVIDKDGRIGIGTTTPKDRLHVVGGVTIESSGETAIRYGNSYGYFQAVDKITPADSFFRLGGYNITPAGTGTPAYSGVLPVVIQVPVCIGDFVSNNTLSMDKNATLDLSASSGKNLVLPKFASSSASSLSTAGSMYYDTSTNTIKVCVASGSGGTSAVWKTLTMA